MHVVRKEIRCLKINNSLYGRPKQISCGFLQKDPNCLEKHKLYNIPTKGVLNSPDPYLFFVFTYRATG